MAMHTGRRLTVDAAATVATATVITAGVNAATTHTATTSERVYVTAARRVPASSAAPAPAAITCTESTTLGPTHVPVPQPPQQPPPATWFSRAFR